MWGWLVPEGSGTATLGWHSVQPTDATTQGPPQPYSGTVAGIPVSGISNPVRPYRLPGPGGGVSLPSPLTLGRWTGSFQGHAFTLNVSFATSALANLNSVTVDIVGTLGSQAVRFTAAPTGKNPNVVIFQGTVGRHHVTGTVQPFQATGADHKATATFTVAG